MIPKDIIEPKKEHFLSVIHFLRDDALKLDKEMFNVQCINTDGSVCREGEEKGRGERKEQIYFKRTNNYLQLEEVMLLIAHSALEIKSDTFATISSDFLPSLHSVQKNKVMIISLSPSLSSPFPLSLPLSRPLPSSLSTLSPLSPLSPLAYVINQARPLEFALVFGDPAAYFKKIRLVAPDQATVSQVFIRLI